MGAALRQSAKGSSSVPVFSMAPLDGSLIVMQLGLAAIPVGFTDRTGDLSAGVGEVHQSVWTRTAASDTGTYSMDAIDEWIIAEFTGVDDETPIVVDTIDLQVGSRVHVATSPVFTGDILIVGAFLHNNALVAGLVVDTGYTLVQSDVYDLNTTKVRAVTYRAATNTGAYDPGIDASPFSGGWSAAALVWAAGEDLSVPEPDPDPLDPGRAIIEIYTTPADSDRWDVALWDTGVWSAAEWVDISPWCVTADVVWGATSGDYGILADVPAGAWVVSTFDPDRVLDPSNADSPFYPELVAGLPIRINHEAVTIRTGVVRRLAYSFADEGGTISATDAVSILSIAKVPEDATLGDTLYSRAEDAIAAAGLDIVVRRDHHWGLDPNPALATYVPAEASVWDVIRSAALEVLQIATVNRSGEVDFRPWMVPLRRGYHLTSPELIDLEAWTDDVGLYSVVRVLDDDTSTVIERRVTPTPRYGERVYAEREDIPTIHGGTWADAILADRSEQSLRFIPGDIRPLDAASVRELAKLQIVEDITLSVPEAAPDVIVEARIMGIRLRVWDETTEYPANIRTRWRWRLVTTQAAAQPLIADGVVPDEFLFADQDTSQPLYPDGVIGL